MRAPSHVIDTSKMVIERTTKPKQKTELSKLLFGKEFTDHMFEVDWQAAKGWGIPRISAFHNLSLEPSCSVFQYASECFEGMKAYKDAQGRIRLFRPDKNIERLNISAQRIVLPSFDQKGFLHCLNELLKVDKDWIPNQKGYSLYLRPTLIGTQPTLGVGPSGSAKLYIIGSPVGPYFPEGWKPVKLLADDKYVRAWPGGTGSCKVGGNYAATIMPQVEAAKKGYTQVLWLFGPEQQITEVGTMNMFVFWINKQGEKELITAPLDGTILPGVTRDSVLSLAREWKQFKVSEAKFTITDLLEALKEKRVLEAFGAGTAAVVSTVQIINYKGEDHHIPIDAKDPNAGIGPLAKKFADTILGIQYGEISHPWSVLVE